MGKIVIALTSFLMLYGCATSGNKLFSPQLMNTDPFLSKHFSTSCSENSLTELKSNLSKTTSIEKRASIWFPLGNCYIQNKNFLLARYYYDLYLASGVSTKENHSKILTNIAMMMEHRDQNYMSLELYDQALIKDPSNRSAMFLKSILLIEFGEYDTANKILRRLDPRNTKSQVVQSLLAISEHLEAPQSSPPTSLTQTLSSVDREIFLLAKRLNVEGVDDEKISQLKNLESELGFVNRFKNTLVATLENNERSKN